MKVQFSQSIDFNQMLVFSVFGHLLLLTVVLFLPKPAFSAKVVVPAFMVNLVSEPTGFKSAAVQRSQSSARVKKPRAKQSDKKSPALKKTTAPKSSEVKKVSAVKTPKPNGILEKVNELETKMPLATPPREKIVEELDQLARLEKPKHKPLATQPIKEKPLGEETFRELETLKNKLEILKNKKVNEIEATVSVSPPQDFLKGFDDPKMEESFFKTFQEPSLLKPQEPVLEKKQAEKPKDPKMDLVKELQKESQKLDKQDASPVSEVGTQEPGPRESMEKGSESFDSAKEKFGALRVPETIRVEISSAKLDFSSFQSKLRSSPGSSQATAESGAGDSYVSAKKEGTPGADIKALYGGRVGKKIHKNWREPLAQEHNRETRETTVVFLIFRHGNIDKPFIKKSSGVEALDTLAVRAVLDSVPFPEFPQELKAPPLRIEMYFKYVPKDE